MTYFRNPQKYQLMGLLAKGRPKCAFCGYRDERALQIDHIYNDGKEDRKWHKHRFNFHKYYLRNSHIALFKLQLLCCNCHFMKTWRFN